MPTTKNKDSKHARARKSALKKKPLNLYLDGETYRALAKRADEWEMKPSQMVSGLVRTLCGLPLDVNQKKVETALKVRYGRDQFLAFLRAVAQALPAEARAVVKADAKEAFCPDSWILGRVGIFAFFSPSGDNVGLVFSSASSFKAEHGLSDVLVVSPLADMMPASARADLVAARIEVVSLATLAERIKGLRSKGRV